MYVDSSSITVNQKTYTRHLLRTSFRKDGKVKHRTIANISSCSDEEIQAVKLGLKYKGNLAELASLDKSMKLQQGLRVGAVWVLLCLAKQLHIVDALGAGRQAKLALWQIGIIPGLAWPDASLTWIVSMKTTSTPRLAARKPEQDRLFRAAARRRYSL